jgi:hypothetical protein
VPPASTPTPAVGVSDIFATAFRRYGGGYVTFGLLAVAMAVPVSAAILSLERTGLGDRALIAVGSLLATAVYFTFVGAVTASAGDRLGRALPAVVATAILATPPIAAVFVLVGLLYAIVVLPFVLPFFVLAPVAAGAADGAGVAACRRALGLVGRRGYLRSLGVMAGLELLALLLWLALRIAFSPIEGRAGDIAATLLWVAVVWPLSAFVFRNLYGALTGRLVLRPESAPTVG